MNCSISTGRDISEVLLCTHHWTAGTSPQVMSVMDRDVAKIEPFGSIPVFTDIVNFSRKYDKMNNSPSRFHTHNE